MKKLLPILFIFSSILAIGQTDTQNPQPRVHRYMDTSRPASEIKSTFPYDIQLRDAENDTLLSHDIFEKNGKPTVLLFWLTTCSPCRAELKAISKKFAEWQKEKEFNLYAVSIDFPRNFERFQQRVKESQWPFPAYHDVNREFRKVMPGELNGLPQVFLLDTEGKIVCHKRKYTPGDEDYLFAEILKH